MRPLSMFTRSSRRAVPAALLVFALAAGPAAAAGLGPEAAHSPNASDIRTTYWVMLAIAVLLAGAALVALFAALGRFRERRGPDPDRATAPRGLMAKVAAGLASLALAIFIFGIVMTESARELEASGPDGLAAQASLVAQVGVSGLPAAAPDDPGVSAGASPTAQGLPLEIDVIGQQWLWRFEYPSDREDIATVFSYNELVVPVDTAVVLNVDSTDVIHRWFVPALGGQVDAVPGEVTRTWFKADETGTYEGVSTMFSGSGYAAMRPKVRVVEAAEYESYVDQLASDLAEAQQAVAGVAGEGAGVEATGDVQEGG